MMNVRERWMRSLGAGGSGPAPSGPTLVDSHFVESVGPDTGGGIVLPWVPTSGNLLVAYVGSGAIPSFPDLSTAVDTADFVGVGIFFSVNAPQTIDFSLSGSAGYVMGFMEWSGNQASPLDSGANDEKNPGPGQPSIALASPAPVSEPVSLVCACASFLTTDGDRSVTGWAGASVTRQFQNKWGQAGGGAIDPLLDAVWYLTSEVGSPSLTATFNGTVRPSGVLTAFKMT